MDKINAIIAELTQGRSYNTEKYSYDREGIPGPDYDDDMSKRMQWKTLAETENHKESISLRKLAQELILNNTEPVICYFLDGSRHICKVNDFAYGDRVYPALAGQVGIGCCRRVNGFMQKERFYGHKVLALPKASNADEWNENGFCKSILNELNDKEFLKKNNIAFDAILLYENPKKDEKIEDQGIISIQNYMLEREQDMVKELVVENKLDNHHFLLKDGSLEYKQMSRIRTDDHDLKKIKYNYENVIGVSKRFNPEVLVDITGHPNSNYIADLPLFHRTPAAKYYTENGVNFAVWYVRIRDKQQTRTPFDGVIKVERIITRDDEKMDSEEIDFLSATLINERNPTCYGKDKRWANHLYPVYLTESFVKSNYISTDTFMNMF